ncbi:peptide deformylase [Clostridium mediterraneense]|uniref:peptide deformylase n=1 Tax=Clostridium mediterraneense TaxID=1805472 RepID=UPI00082CEDF1|nr:peptide deformylase [Clostridium mediterraneense]
MAVREIVQLGDEHLRKISEPVKNIDEVQDLIKDLKDTLATVEGIGLAAPQIAVNKRVIYINFQDGVNEYVLINPEILESSKKTCVDYEGCLSYVMHEGLVERPKKVTIQALNENGELKVYKADELLARCFQHEIDHLNGIMYTDLATELFELTEEDFESFEEE